MQEPDFAILTPDFIMDAIESLGYLCSGSNIALNSYENRVYQVGIDEDVPIIAKFYRPNRWSDDQILEEHRFSHQLAQQDISIVEPINLEGKTLFFYKGMRFALFLRQGGHAPEFDNLDQLFHLGQQIARIHNVGESEPFKVRTKITIEEYAIESQKFLLEHFIPDELKPAYQTLTDQLIEVMQEKWPSADQLTLIGVHGDCHIGNILWRDDQAHFVDLDDCKTAPAIQDIWMLLSGDRENQTKQLSEVVEGYEMFRDFDRSQIKLIEVMRTLRIMHYSAWLARRWDDPAFKSAFTWFNTVRYWSEHILQLREQQAALQEPELQLF